MSSILNQFERFLALFETLKTAAGEPRRLAIFYSESSAIRDAATKLEEFALELTYDLEWFGQKRLGPVRSGFEQAWVEYQTQWVPAIKYGSLCDRLLKGESKHDLRELNPYDPNDWNLNPDPERQEPDPDRDEFSDPVRHDGGLAVTLGIDHWRGEVHRAKVIANKCQIAVDAHRH